MLGAFLKVFTWLTLLVLDLVLYLCVIVLATLVLLLVFSPLLGSHGADNLMYPIFSPQFPVLANFHFSWCNCWIFAWLIILIFFAGCTCWRSYGYESTIVTLRGSALVNGFDWDAYLIWVISWFTSWSFSWNSPLIGTLRGTAGGIAFLNISARDINTSLCELTILTSGISGAGFYSA